MLRKKTQKRNIYLDHASSTPIDAAVLHTLNKINKNVYGNPSGIHKKGVEARSLLENARKTIAESLRAHGDEIIFTSGGTESDNLALLGILFAYKEKKNIKPHIVISSIEHAALFETVRYLEKIGEIEASYISVDEKGFINNKELKNSLKENTIFVSIIHGNNEIGVIQNIQEIAKTIRHFKKNVLNNQYGQYPVFHTDACQSYVYIPIHVEALGVDLLTINSSKIYGPKGVGVLYKKRNILLSSVFHGGDQEFGFRPGTENLPAIVSFAKAVEINESLKKMEPTRLKQLQSYFFSKLEENFDVQIHGNREERLPNNVNVTFIGYQSEQIVIYLDAEGISVSEKSACKSEDGQISHVIKALYKDNKNTKYGSVRFSMGRSTKKQDLDIVINTIKKILQNNLLTKVLQ